ncbi:hypothetical protein CRUP_025786, partial [Coryphaenoides rupestris]
RWAPARKGKERRRRQVISLGPQVKADRDESSPYAAMLLPLGRRSALQGLGIHRPAHQLRATGGNRTKTPGPGAQSALRALLALG